MTAKEIVEQRNAFIENCDLVITYAPELPSFPVSDGQAEFEVTKLGELSIGGSSTRPILIDPATATELAAWLSELYPPEVTP